VKLPCHSDQKTRERLVLSFVFCLTCRFEAVLRSKMQVRIPRLEIDKLACQAKSVGITERSEVTLSLRPKNKREARPLFCFLLDVSIRSCFAKQNAGSHSPLGDRQARLSGEERGNHGA